MGDWLRAGLPLADLRAGGLYAGAAGASNDHAEGFAACFVVTTPPPVPPLCQWTLHNWGRQACMYNGLRLRHHPSDLAFTQGHRLVVRFNQIYARFCLLPSSLAFQRPLEPAWTLGPTALPSCV